LPELFPAIFFCIVNRPARVREQTRRHVCLFFISFIFSLFCYFCFFFPFVGFGQSAKQPLVTPRTRGPITCRQMVVEASETKEVPDPSFPPAQHRGCIAYSFPGGCSRQVAHWLTRTGALPGHAGTPVRDFSVKPRTGVFYRILAGRPISLNPLTPRHISFRPLGIRSEGRMSSVIDLGRPGSFAKSTQTL